MRLYQPILLAGTVYLACSVAGFAAEFDAYGNAPANLTAVQGTPDVVIELGLGIGAAPVYEGASEYGPTFSPIIKLERLNIPGLIDIGGTKQTGGFSFAPSFSMAKERLSGDYAVLNGLDDVKTTYALGGRVGYELALSETMSTEIYGAVRYAFGGAEGLLGEVGVNVTAKLSPQFEIIGGPVLNFASEDYMDTYFGVTGAESIATGGRLGAYDPSGGIKSAGLVISARYEFVPDTFVSLNAAYTGYVGDALDSPIVTSGSESQFVIGAGLSRRFSFKY